MVSIVLFEQIQGKANIHSSKIRGRWIAEHWPEDSPWGPAEVHRFGKKYEAVIYQKAYWFKQAENFEGLKILDICDADFLHFGYPVKRMIEACDGVVCSTLALAETISGMTMKPVAVIDDRFDFTKFPRETKEHHDGPAESVAWHGYSENYPMLDAAVSVLPRNGIKKLIVIADQRSPYRAPVGVEGKIEVVNYPWTEETVYHDLMRADIVLNPQSKWGRYGYKSRNKSVMAWAMGLPVAHTEEELKKLIDPEARLAEAKKRYLHARHKYDIKQSVSEMIEFMKICAQEAGKSS